MANKKKTVWKCPMCGALPNKHGSGGEGQCGDPFYRQNGWCQGFLCDCVEEMPSEHGESQEKACPNAVCFHCGWTGRFPLKEASSKATPPKDSSEADMLRIANKDLGEQVYALRDEVKEWKGRAEKAESALSAELPAAWREDLESLQGCLERMTDRAMRAEKTLAELEEGRVEDLGEILSTLKRLRWENKRVAGRAGEAYKVVLAYGKARQAKLEAGRKSEAAYSVAFDSMADALVDLNMFAAEIVEEDLKSNTERVDE